MSSQTKNISDAIRRWLTPDSGAHDSSALQGEELFARFMRHLPGLAWLKDLSGHFVFANDAALRAFAPGLSDITGKTNSDLLDSVAASQCDRSDREAANSESGIEVTETYRHADGTSRVMLVNKFPIFGANGKVNWIGGIAIDITAREQAEEKLRLSEERLRLATEAGNVGVWEWDVVRNRVTWTPSLYEMHGLTPEQFDGRVESFAALTHPDDQARVMQAIDAALKGEKPYEIEFRIVRPNGEITWLYTSAHVVRDNGTPVRMLGTTVNTTARKQTELKLRESEERFAKAFNASPMSLTITSLRTGKILEVNEGFIATSGYTREEAIGRTTVDLGLWMSTAERAAEMEAVRDSGKVRKIEYRFRAKNGKEILGLLSAERIDIGGEPYALTVIEDLSERELAQRALRQSEERLRLALHGASAGVWTWELPSGKTFWSAEFDVLYGFDSSTERTLERWLESVHADDRERVRASIHACASSSECEFRQEFRIVHPTRGVRWILDLGRIDRDTTSGQITFGGISLDITERKQMENALRTSERLYRAIGESIDYGVWICDATGRNTYVSESFLKLVGLTQAQCSKFGWAEVLHPDDVERTVAAWKECVRTGDRWDIQHRFRGVDGKWHPVLARGLPVRNENGEIIAWAGINLDISHLKEVEDELREADQRKNEFLATLAHELRNPLAPIRNGLEIMKLTKGSGEAAERARMMMDRQLKQMVRLIDDLLDLSRISRGKIDLRMERVDLFAIVRSAIESSEPLINEARHELKIDVPPEPLFVVADQTRLAQVFANLLNNAAKYTDSGGRIELTVKRARDCAVITVRDSGIGIPTHMLPRVFEMFTQVDRSLEKAQGGLGIGLSIAKRLVEMHGGSIEAHSEGPGTGSEFIVSLPIAMPERATVRNRASFEAQAPAASNQSLRVLIADDNVDAATSLALMLELQGNEVRVARDGAEAVQIAKEFAPQVALLDIGMPVLNGYDACRQLRQQAGGADRLIVALTGWGQEADKQRSQRAGFDHHLIKPVDVRMLEELLAQERNARAKK